MAWSTRELAHLAGTTVNTVRHYHQLGLLEEPDRRYNGYKQYGVAHLVRLLRIRRLADLGVPLSQIETVHAGSSEGTLDALRELDRELAEDQQRITRVRADIAAILAGDSPADGPAGFESAAHLSEADRAMIHVFSRLYDEEAMADVRQMVADDAGADSLNDEISALPADADGPTRQRLAERLAPRLAQNLLDYPWMRDPVSHLSQSERVTQQTFVEAMVELYNPAQLDMLHRASLLIDPDAPPTASAPGI